MNQVEAIENFLAWLKSCPFKCTISSMQGSFVHVKFFLGKTIDEEEEKLTTSNVNDVYVKILLKYTDIHNVLNVALLLRNAVVEKQNHHKKTVQLIQ